MFNYQCISFDASLIYCKLFSEYFMSELLTMTRSPARKDNMKTITIQFTIYRLASGYFKVCCNVF